MIVIDDFIKDQNLLDEIQNDKTYFDDNGDYMWWDGWWNSPADTLKKRVIQYIWGENSPYDSVSIAGFEYWTGQYDNTKPEGLKFHLDKDEALYMETKEILSPIIGTVYYPWENDIDGGYLEIFESNPFESDVTTERIAAKQNRLVIFPAGQKFHRVTPVTRGLRSAMAINLWGAEPSGVKNGGLILENK